MSKRSASKVKEITNAFDVVREFFALGRNEPPSEELLGRLAGILDRDDTIRGAAEDAVDGLTRCYLASPGGTKEQIWRIVHSGLGTILGELAVLRDLHGRLDLVRDWNDDPAPVPDLEFAPK